MALTRAEEFAETRRVLCRPKHQSPSSDDIVSDLISAEQHLLNRQNNTKRTWSKNTGTITTVLNQAEYTVTPTTGSNTVGKPFFVYRDYGNNVLVPIPYTDYGSEIGNQSHELVAVPPVGTTAPEIYGVSSVKIAFFRQGSAVKARLYPVPETAGIIYNVFFSDGRLEWSTWAWTDTPTLPEFSRLRVLHASLANVKRCEWDGYLMDENRMRRNELRGDLKEEYLVHDEEFESFIRNPQNEGIEDSGYWWE